MPKLRRISGNELLKLLINKGFVFIRQKGSHTRVVYDSGNNKHYLTVPLHSELDRGTLRSIMRSAEKCLAEEDIREIFYK